MASLCIRIHWCIPPHKAQGVVKVQAVLPMGTRSGWTQPLAPRLSLSSEKGVLGPGRGSELPERTMRDWHRGRGQAPCREPPTPPGPGSQASTA